MTTEPLSKDDYRELRDHVRDAVAAHVPPGSVVLVVSKGDDELLHIHGLRAWHFPRHESGTYAGHYPNDSVEALSHLRRLYSNGAQYLVVPWSALWWLDHYQQLAHHLNTSHHRVASVAGVCVIYELRESESFAAFERARMDEECAHDDAPLEPAARVGLAPVALHAPLRVLTILARFGTWQYPHAKEEIDDIFRRQMPGVNRTLLVVDNALPREAVIDAVDHVVIGGDNSAREFSGFDRALEFVGADIWSYDLVHFATSAFNTLYVAYIERFDEPLLAAIAGRALCVGHLDCYNEPISVRTYESQHWIRSCFFFLPSAEAKALGSFVSVADGRGLFSGNPDNPFRGDAPIGAGYRQYITQWLTGQDIGQGVEWHSSFALTSDTLEEFQHKTQAILNEHLLFIRLRALGCRLVDVTWLSAILRRRGAADIPWRTTWREQMAGRDRDALVPPGSRQERVELAAS